MNRDKQSIQSMVDCISENIKGCKNHYIIGIDGYSGSGKTTFTQGLIQYFEKDYKVFVFHIDDHITTRKYRYNTGYEQWYEYFYLQWDADYIKKSLLEPIKENADQVKLQFYNNDDDSITEHITYISQKSIIIIEGVFLQRIEWRSYFNFMIFIDCPREIRFERELIRSNHKDNLDIVISKYKERYWAAEDYYETTYKPSRLSDWVISNY